jgi:hypothetical protein
MVDYWRFLRALRVLRGSRAVKLRWNPHGLRTSPSYHFELMRDDLTCPPDGGRGVALAPLQSPGRGSSLDLRFTNCYLRLPVSLVWVASVASNP